MRPRLLDLFCGAGGAAMGYHRAGFDVTGVDIRPQPCYPFRFYQADALEFLDLLRNGVVGDWDVIHASPPCLAYSVCTAVHAKDRHPDLLGPVRERLMASGLPWIIENVPGAPMRADFKLCGCMFGLAIDNGQLLRERWFETRPMLFDLRQPCVHLKRAVTVTDGGRGWTVKEQEAAMGIDWMGSRELLALAVPPAYTEYIGRQLLDVLAPATT